MQESLPMITFQITIRVCLNMNYHIPNKSIRVCLFILMKLQLIWSYLGRYTFIYIPPCTLIKIQRKFPPSTSIPTCTIICYVIVLILIQNSSLYGTFIDLYAFYPVLLLKSREDFHPVLVFLPVLLFGM